jgi:hypothetical protein
MNAHGLRLCTGQAGQQPSWRTLAYPPVEGSPRWEKD